MANNLNLSIPFIPNLWKNKQRNISRIQEIYIYIKENLKNLPSNLLVVTKCSTRDFSCSIDQQISNTVKWDTGPVHAPLRLANRVQLSLSWSKPRFVIQAILTNFSLFPAWIKSYHFDSNFRSQGEKKSLLNVDITFVLQVKI